ncbi:MAG TPA: hypothetical protein VIV57_13170, partial [Anaeromyxobacter sp.]
MPNRLASELRALAFDVYGTIVDWRGSVLAELSALAARKGLSLGPERFLDEWKGSYRPAMDRVNRGEAPFATVDAIYRARLAELLAGRGIALAAEEVDDLPEAFASLLRRMLARDPAARPTPREAAEALEPLVAAVPDRLVP